MGKKIIERLEAAGWGIGSPALRSLHAVSRASDGFEESHEQAHDHEVRLISERFDLAMYEKDSTYAVLSFCTDPDVEQEAADYGLLSASIEESCRNYIDARADLKNGSDYAVDASGDHMVVFTYGANRAYDEVFVFHKIAPEAVPSVMERWEEASLLPDAEAVAEDAFWDRDAVASSADLIADIRNSLQERKEVKTVLNYYVQRFEPYYGSGLEPLRYKGSSLEDAIRCFKELPSSFGDKKREALNALGVEYEISVDGAKRTGACDLIQERFDKPLFLSQDYRVMQVKDVPEVAEKAVGALKDAFNLNAFGQLVNRQVEIDGVQWVIRHFHERDLILAECYDAGLNVYKQGSVMMSAREAVKEYVIQDSRTGETIGSFDSFSKAFEAARVLVEGMMAAKGDISREMRESQEASRDIGEQQPDRSQRWQERTR